MKDNDPKIDPVLENYLLKMEVRIIEKSGGLFAPIIAWTLLLGMYGIFGAALVGRFILSATS